MQVHAALPRCRRISFEFAPWTQASAEARCVALPAWVSACGRRFAFSALVTHPCVAVTTLASVVVNRSRRARRRWRRCRAFGLKGLWPLRAKAARMAGQDQCFEKTSLASESVQTHAVSGEQTPVAVFWDLDNKTPPPGVSLAALVTMLPEKLPDFGHGPINIYSNLKTLSYKDFQLAKSFLLAAWGPKLESFLAEFDDVAPHGATLEFGHRPADDTAMPLPAVTLTVMPDRPEAADSSMVCDLVRAVTPISAIDKPGTVCVISDDTDFKRPLVSARQCGWRVVIVSKGPLRSISDDWLMWDELIAAASTCSEEAAGHYGFSGQAQLKGNSGICLSTFAAANQRRKELARRGIEQRRSRQRRNRAAAIRSSQESRTRGARAAELLPCFASFPEGQDGRRASIERMVEMAGPPASDASALEPFFFYSSLDCPFLAVSESQLTVDVRAPNGAECDMMLAFVRQYVTQCESEGKVMVVDFEGEMPGHGGVLTTAAVQATSSVDSTTLAPTAQSSETHHTPGLLIDLRFDSCVDILRRIMESERITKIGWGSDADCKCLMYQLQPIRLEMQPASLVDAQLAFSEQGHRIGMKHMLNQVPTELVSRLPSKHQIDFESQHCYNKAVFAPPISSTKALYAVDDLHRIETILRSQKPPGGDYLGARKETAQSLKQIRADPHGVKDLTTWKRGSKTQSGKAKLVRAVKAMRHIRSLRVRKADLGYNQSLVNRVEAEVARVLNPSAVYIPDDLSFAA